MPTGDAQPTGFGWWARLAVLVAFAVAAAGCTSSTTSAGLADDSPDTTAAPVAPVPSPTPAAGSSVAPESPADPESRQRDQQGSEPVPFVPGGPVGDQAAYIELIDRLEVLVPGELRGQVPWPDLRNADPVVAQEGIFDLWVFMTAQLPEPALAPAIAAESSPSRALVVALFAELQANGVLHSRDSEPYVAFDHRVVAAEFAELPRWLRHGVPDGSVVIYYQDRSGPLTVRDRATGEVLAIEPAVGARQWLSIMAPTDVGWLLWRDLLLDSSQSDIEVPEFAPPSADIDDGRPEV